MNIREEYEKKKVTLEEALASVRSGEQLCTGGILCEPISFVERFHEIVPRLEDVVFLKGRNIDVPFLFMPDLKDHVTVVGHLYDATMRKCAKNGAITHIPCNLHDFMINRTAYMPIDRLIVTATPMDENGDFYVSGCGMWEYVAAENARHIILEVNPQLPRFGGALKLNISQIDMFYEAPRPLIEYPRAVPTETDKVIAETIASMVHDGDCIQIGIGGMPDMVGRAFMDKKDLGLHTELFTPVVGELIEAGVITDARKNIDRGKHVGSFAMGDQKLYDTLAKDPNVQFASIAYTNDPWVIAQIDNMVSVNTAMEIDLTGQICSESIGPMQFSGTGGAFDFAFGAMHSKGGRSIMAIASTAKGGTISKIKATLTPGAVVSVPRNAADIIVTEYGVAYMRGRTVRERVQNLIAIAHPDYREELTFEAKKLLWI